MWKGSTFSDLLPSSPGEWEFLLLNAVNILLALVVLGIVVYVSGGSFLEMVQRRKGRAHSLQMPRGARRMHKP